MAATAPKTSTFMPELEAVGERMREANDRLTEVSRKVATAYVDAIENYLADFAKFERKLGEQTKVPAAAGLLSRHAELTESVTKASVSAARELISA